MAHFRTSLITLTTVASSMLCCLSWFPVVFSVFICELAEILRKLFNTDLKFSVEVHKDLTRDTLERLLLTTSEIDHSDFDAFVCCLLTHGRVGVLYTSDAMPIRILDIVEYFNDDHCVSLQGKPKMFFIQACMTGESN